MDWQLIHYNYAMNIDGPELYCKPSLVRTRFLYIAALRLMVKLCDGSQLTIENVHERGRRDGIVGHTRVIPRVTGCCL